MALSQSEKLQIFENIAIRVAQGLVGGVITGPNHPCGDLMHKDGTFSEVKSANQCSGAIIRRKQILWHYNGPTRDYVLVFHTNRVWKNGRYHYVAMRARTREGLEKHLFDNIREVYVVDIEAMRMLYDRFCRSRREKTHHFKSGPKTYIKVRQLDFINHLARVGVSHSLTSESVRIGSRVIRFGLTRIEVTN